jgi:HAE1 family hydrophobic/amphiphilic exporter-1
VSVIISAFNALMLAPALSAMLRPRQEARGVLARSFAVFNVWFTKATRGYIDLSRALIRKAVVGILILVGFALASGLFGKRLPASFVPEEDYGFLFLNLQLPPAASLERTDQVSRKIESILKETEGVQSYTTIDGFSLLNCISTNYNGFFCISLEPWGDRKHTALEIQKSINARLTALRSDASMTDNRREFYE